MSVVGTTAKVGGGVAVALIGGVGANKITEHNAPRHKPTSITGSATGLAATAALAVGTVGALHGADIAQRLNRGSAGAAVMAGLTMLLGGATVGTLVGTMKNASTDR